MDQLGEIKIINDFLPNPKELVLKENTIKVTLMLSKESIGYFKKEAGKQYTHYQTMIGALLDKYTKHHQEHVH